MYLYARCLDQGLGTVQDLLGARQWYEKAAQAGSKPAKEWLTKNGIS
jgi:TPR repeat protein